MSSGHQCKFIHCHRKVWRVRSEFCSPECTNKAEQLATKLKRSLAGKVEPKTHCANGHEYTAGNVYEYRGYRRCLQCMRARGREYDQLRRAK